MKISRTTWKEFKVQYKKNESKMTISKNSANDFTEVQNSYKKEMTMKQTDHGLIITAEKPLHYEAWLYANTRIILLQPAT